MPQLLLITRDRHLKAELSGMLAGSGFLVTGHVTNDGGQKPDFTGFDCILAEAEVVEHEGLLRQQPQCPIIVLASQPDVRQSVQAMKRGASDYLPLPLDADELLNAVESMLANAPMRLDSRQHSPFALAGSSSAMKAIRERVAEVASTHSAVLIEGESGTGKVSLAYAIHAASRRVEAPLIVVNCAEIPESMIEAELFGQDSTNGNLIERAEGGTLLLEDVGNLPAALQSRLLPLVCGNQPQRRDGTAMERTPRVIASSHRNLRQSVEQGEFLAGLLRCLKCAFINLPPLREHQEDAIELAEMLLEQAGRKLDKAPLRLSGEAVDAIRRHRWPGNLRELANAIERAVLLCDDGTVTADHLAIDIGLSPTVEQAEDEREEPVSLEEYFVSFVLQHQEQLTETEIARKLGISRKNLWERRQRLNIPRTKTRKRGPRRP